MALKRLKLRDTAGPAEAQPVVSSQECAGAAHSHPAPLQQAWMRGELVGQVDWRSLCTRLIELSIAALCLLALAAEAAAASSGPFEFSYGGRLTTADGAPLGGAVDLELAFYRSEVGGDSLGAPLGFPATSLSAGVFQVAVSLDATEARAIFPDTEQPVWVEVRDLTHGRTYPRQRFLGTPYALRVPVDGVTLQFDAAGALRVVQAPNFSGALAGDVEGNQATTVVTKIRGAPVASTPAAAGQVLKWNGAAWAPADDAGGAAANSNAANLTSGTLDDARLSANVSLLGPTIEGSEIAAGAVSAAQLADGGVTPAKLASAGCGAGQVLKWNGSAWACANDVDTNTPTTSASSLTSGTLDDARLSANVSKLGATIEGNEIAAGAVTATQLADGAVTAVKLASAGCTAGQMLKWSGSAWACASDVDTNTPTTNAADLTTGTLGDARLSANVSKLGATVESSEITDGTITGDDIASGTIGDAHLAAGIDALKIGGGSVSSTELGYLDGVTSSIQTQLADRVAKLGDELSGSLSVNIATGAGTQNAVVVKNSQRLRFENDQASPNSISLRAPTGVFTNQAYVLPAAPGSAGQVLQTDASGNLSWASPGSSLSTLSQLTVSCAAGQVIKSDGGGSWSCQADADSGGAGGSTPADGSVSTVKLVDGAVTAAKLNSMGCLSGQIMKYSGSTWTCAADDNNSITSDASLLTSGTLAAARLPATVSLFGATIDSSEIADGAVTTSKLAADAVSSAKILDGSVANADISGSAAIATSKLSGAVTAISGHGLGSLAALSAVGSLEITNDSIVDADIASAAAISSTKISFVADSISGDAIHGGVISDFQSTGIEDNAASVAMTIDVSRNVGIGTTAPTQALSISRSDESTGVLIENTSSTSARWPALEIRNFAGATGGYGSLIFKTGRGTSAARSATQANDDLGMMAGYADDGTTWRGASAISFNAEENTTSSAAGGNIRFHTTPLGSTTSSERVRITAAGNVGIGTTSPAAALHVAGSIGVTGAYLQLGCPSGSTLRATNLCMDNSDRAGANFHDGQATCQSLGGHMCTYTEVYRAWPNGNTQGNHLGNRGSDDASLYINGTVQTNFDGNGNKDTVRPYRCCWGPWVP